MDQKSVPGAFVGQGEVFTRGSSCLPGAHSTPGRERAATVTGKSSVPLNRLRNLVVLASNLTQAASVYSAPSRTRGPAVGAVESEGIDDGAGDGTADGDGKS